MAQLHGKDRHNKACQGFDPKRNDGIHRLPVSQGNSFEIVQSYAIRQ